MDTMSASGDQGYSTGFQRLQPELNAPLPSVAGRSFQERVYEDCGLQIAAHLRNGILQGSLPAGTQFLGSREIARELGCSRTVILTAWDLLYAEGYLESTPRGGVTVASVKQAQVNPGIVPR